MKFNKKEKIKDKSKKESLIKSEKDEKVKKNKIEITQRGRDLCRKCFTLIQNKSWIFTVFVFLLVFIFALYIWDKYIFSDNPNQEIINEFQSKELQIDQKVEKIEGVIEKIQKREENFNNLPDYSNSKRIFVPEEEINTATQEAGNSPETVQ